MRSARAGAVPTMPESLVVTQWACRGQKTEVRALPLTLPLISLMTATAQSQAVQTPNHLSFIPHASTRITLCQADPLLACLLKLHLCVLTDRPEHHWWYKDCLCSQAKERKTILAGFSPNLSYYERKENLLQLKTMYSLTFHSVLKNNTEKESPAIYEFSSWWLFTNMAM